MAELKDSSKNFSLNVEILSAEDYNMEPLKTTQMTDEEVLSIGNRIIDEHIEAFKNLASEKSREKL